MFLLEAKNKLINLNFDEWWLNERNTRPKRFGKEVSYFGLILMSFRQFSYFWLFNWLQMSKIKLIFTECSFHRHFFNSLFTQSSKFVWIHLAFGGNANFLINSFMSKKKFGFRQKYENEIISFLRWKIINYFQHTFWEVKKILCRKKIKETTIQYYFK